MEKVYRITKAVILLTKYKDNVIVCFDKSQSGKFSSYGFCELTNATVQLLFYVLQVYALLLYFGLPNNPFTALLNQIVCRPIIVTVALRPYKCIRFSLTKPLQFAYILNQKIAIFFEETRPKIQVISLGKNVIFYCEGSISTVIAHA